MYYQGSEGSMAIKQGILGRVLPFHSISTFCHLHVVTFAMQLLASCIYRTGNCLQRIDK